MFLLPNVKPIVNFMLPLAAVVLSSNKLLCSLPPQDSYAYCLFTDHGCCIITYVCSSISRISCRVFIRSLYL
uniref:Uncharacterized protein n=1 Tax=Ciona intestinalis TaxID=7719 RepID=H2XRD2_CIOIN